MLKFKRSEFIEAGIICGDIVKDTSEI